MAETQDDKLLERAKRCFKLASEAEAQQRQREQDDLRFQVPELQWDETARQQRMGGLINTGSGGTVTAPARPILSIPKLAQPIQQVINQAREAHLGVNIHPLSPDAEQEVADVIQGLYREIERDSKASQARIWAFERSVQCGRGAYRVTTEWDEEGGDPFDQVIRIRRILYQDTVYFDPAATKPDFSDGEYAFVGGWMDKDTFEREFPDAQIPTEETEFKSALQAEPNWVKLVDGKKAYFVAEYFYKEHEDIELYLLPTGQVVNELPKGMQVLAQRTLDQVSVKHCKLTGFQVLEKNDWPGKFIPLIPTLGQELQPFDESRRWQGIIGPNKDAQRAFNYSASNAVELVALEPRAPWIMAEGQDENYEHEWDQSNTRNIPVLHYRPMTIGDKPAPPPQRVQIDVSRLGPSMTLLQQSDGWLQAGTYQYDPSLGRSSGKERSGKAILAQQEQGIQSNSHFLNNLADISMSYEATVILDLIPIIYGRPGRLARTLNEHEESEQVILNAPFTRDPNTERPIPMGPKGPRMPQNGNGQAPAGQPPKVMEYDLRKGVYSVSVSIGKSYQSKLQAGAEEIGEILTARPELMPLIGPLYFRYRDFPGAPEIADLLKKVRDKQFPGIDEPDEGSPEQLQAVNQQLQQENEQLKQQLQGAAQQIQTDQAKQQATLQKAQIDAESKIQVAQIDQQTQLMLKELQGRIDALESMSKGEREAQANQAKIAGEVAKESVKGEYQVEAADLNYKATAVGALAGERDQI